MKQNTIESIKITRNEYDAYESLKELQEKVYDEVQPSKKIVQQKLTQYTNINKEKKKIERDWGLYQKAMNQEKLMFFRILKDAVDHMMINYEYKGNGRPPAYYADIVKSICIRAYHNLSGCRAKSELKIARAMGVIDEVYANPTLMKYMQDPRVVTLLHQLYKIIAQPLSKVEVDFAADATGISNTYGNTRWMKIRHTKEELKHRREYSKLHIVSGVKTNVICSAKISKSNVHECPHLRTLLNDTARNFTIKEVSADAGYLSKDNVNAITDLGAEPYIMPKKNVNVPMGGPSTPWNSMLRLWKKNQMFFAEKYHKRSNVESTFSALKRKFGDFCRCKKENSRETEILGKITCFNACVLSEALMEGLVIGFGF